MREEGWEEEAPVFMGEEGWEEEAPPSWGREGWEEEAPPSWGRGMGGGSPAFTRAVEAPAFMRGKERFSALWKSLTLIARFSAGGYGIFSTL